MEFTITLLTFGLLLPALISAQISFFDNRFPPAPAARRVIIRNGQLSGARSARIQQAPIVDELLDEPPVSQVHESDSQEAQEPDSREQDIREPIVQEPVPTQRPLRGGNGLSQQTIPSRFARPTPPQQQQDFGQTLVGGDEGSDEFVAQKEDSVLTDVPMEDVSTEGLVPSVTFTSSEEGTTDDGFTPTEPVLRPQPIPTGPIVDQRKGRNGNGRQKPIQGIGRKSLIANGQKPTNGKGRKPPGRGRDRQVVQVVDSGDEQTIDGQLSDGQVSDGRVTDGGVSGGQVSNGQTVSKDQDISQDVSGEGQSHGSGDDSGHHDHHSGDPIQWLREAVRGEPGADYPIFYTPPETGFKCTEQQWPGYYADVDARCQVFHICQLDGRSDAFLCPNGTIFSQEHFVCVWWHDFDCSTAQSFYGLNSQLYSTPDAKSSEEPVDEQAIDRPSGRPTGPGVGRPSTGPSSDGSFDTFGRGQTGVTDGRIQSSVGQDSGEAQEPELPQQIDTDSPSVPTAGSPGSQETVSGEAPVDEVVTIQTGSRGGANGRPLGGVKGGAKIGRKNGSNGLVKKNGQNGSSKRTGSTSSPTKPIISLKRNGSTKKTGINGQSSIPSSPADNARNGLQKSGRTNGAGNGGQQRQRTSSGTKSQYRRAQRHDIDGQASNRWYYLNL